MQTGAGRTGTWFASEQWPVAPDLITTAKSLAGGFPLAGVVGQADVIDAPAPGGLGGTDAGSPVACAAALAVIEAFAQEKLLARSQAMGALLVRGLKDIAAKVPTICDVRGLGAMVAIELFENGDLGRPAATLTKQVVAEAARRGAARADPAVVRHAWQRDPHPGAADRLGRAAARGPGHPGRQPGGRVCGHELKCDRPSTLPTRHRPP